MDYISNFIAQYGALFAQGTWDTIVMTIVSTFFAYVIGVPLGVLLVVTAKDGLRPHRALNHGARLDREHRPFHPVHHPAGGHHPVHALGGWHVAGRSRAPSCR